MAGRALDNLTREQLVELIEIYCKNWLAMDGVWFQSVENKYGMAEAMEHDCNIWRIFTKLEAQKLKRFLNLPPRAGLEGLKRALELRLYTNINRDEIIIEGNTLIYRTLDCRVQNARRQKGLEFHPCKAVGLIEYGGFAREIDDRITCEVLSCYPDITDDSCNCAWKFTLHE